MAKSKKRRNGVGADASGVGAGVVHATMIEPMLGTGSSTASSSSAIANASSHDTDTTAAAAAATVANLAPPPALRVYWQRWYVLAVFSLLSFDQSLFWLSFSPINDQAMTYFGITQDTTNLLLNWGPIIYVPTIVFTFYLSTIPNGLRPIALAASLMCAIGMCIRCIPAWIDPHSTAALACLHIAHILNACAGPMVMAPVSQLSCIWFPVHERTTSTSIAVFSNWFGSGFGFIFITNIVQSPDDIPKLLYAHAGLAVFAALLVIAYFPTAPPTPPSVASTQVDLAGKKSSASDAKRVGGAVAGSSVSSKSSSASSRSSSVSSSRPSLSSDPAHATHVTHATLDIGVTDFVSFSNGHELDAHHHHPHHLHHLQPRAGFIDDSAAMFAEEAREDLRHRHHHGHLDDADAAAAAEAAAGSPSLRLTIHLVYKHFRTCISDPSTLCLTLSGGIIPGVFSSWSALFDSMFPDLSAVENGWLGFVATMGAIVGGVLVGRLADYERLSRSYMRIIVLSNVACLIVNLIFIFTVPSPWWSEPLLSINLYSSGVLLALVGCTMGMSSAVYYELAAEIAFPVPESYPAGLLTCWNNLSGVIFIFLASPIPPSVMNLFMLGVLAIALLLLLGVKVAYRRKDQDADVNLVADLADATTIGSLQQSLLSSGSSSSSGSSASLSGLSLLPSAGAGATSEDYMPPPLLARSPLDRSGSSSAGVYDSSMYLYPAAVMYDDAIGRARARAAGAAGAAGAAANGFSLQH